MKAELVPKNGDPPIPITRDVTVVGRREYCDVKIDHPGLSKRHCVIVRTDGLLIVRDLATTNGTKLNGQKVRWAALRPDDRLSLAGYKVKVYLGSDSAPAPSEQPTKRGASANTPEGAPAGKSPPVLVEVDTDDAEDDVATAPLAPASPLVELDTDDDEVIVLPSEPTGEAGWDQHPLNIKLD